MTDVTFSKDKAGDTGGGVENTVDVEVSVQRGVEL